MDNSTEQGREPRPARNGSAAHDDPHAGEAERDADGPFHFAAHPGRRNGERWSLSTPANAPAKRLYGRAKADAPPEPDNLRDTYAEALALVERYRPLRAARLDDLIGRVEHAFKRYCATKKEEEAHFQNSNEEARNANEWIDNRVGLLRAERDNAAERWDTELAERRDTLALCNEDAAAAHTASGSPMPYAYRGLEDPAPPSGTQAAQEHVPAHTSTQTALLPAERAANGLLSRLRGGLRFGARTNGTAVGGTAGEDAPPPTVPLAGGLILRPRRQAFPDPVPFPLTEGLEQATPLEATAMQQGLPFKSPAAEAMDSRQNWMAWVALVACGSIFGASIGLLTHLVRLTDFQVNFVQSAVKIGVLCLLGIFMFWVLGRVAYAAAAMASEDRHLHLTAGHRDDPLKMGEWLGRAARWMLFVLLLVSVALVAVEAVVERYGIVAAFADAAQNSAIASGGQGSVVSVINPLALVCMVLTVSLPFVLFHMAHGWADARSKTIRHYLQGRQALQAWQIAQKCHAERTAQKAALFATEQAEEDQAWHKAEAEAAQAKHAVQAAQAQAAADANTGIAGASIEGLAEGSTGLDAEETIAKEEVARILARAWEAEQRWRRTRRERQEAIAWYDERIKAYEAERQKENPQPEQVGRQHVDSAYNAYTGALKHFEDTYLREVRQVEKMMQAGLLVRLWLALMRQPVMDTEGLLRRP